MTVATPAVIRDLDDLISRIGEPIGPSGALEVSQDRISAFADVTGDHQWIHVEVDRAAAGPFGSTIAHGYLTLSLLPLLAKDLVRFEGFSAAVNYGLERVRFPSPVKVGTRLHAYAEFVSAEETHRGIRAVIRYTVRNADTDELACVADAVTLLAGAP